MRRVCALFLCLLLALPGSLLAQNKTESKPAAPKTETKAANKTEAKPAPKPVPKTGNKTEAKSDAKPDAKSDKKPDPKAAKPEPNKTLVFEPPAANATATPPPAPATAPAPGKPSPSRDDDRVLELRQQIVELQNDGALGIGNLRLVAKINGFANIIPLDGSTFAANSTILFYYEPVNWYTKRSDNKFEFSLAQDLRIKSGEEVIYSKENMLQYALATARPVLDLHFPNTIELRNFAPGNYTCEVVLRDMLKGKEARATFPFQVTGK